MLNSRETRDLELAFNLHEEINALGVTENAVIPKTKDKQDYKPRTLVDQTLELIDPTPNIYTLFMQFNARFFWNVLLSVEVKWSNRMTSCAGICYYHPKNKQCVISLSVPLLKLRPRKDLVETLLHEMIHGYLFITNNNRDRDGHGPEFCKHMHRINKEAGTNITIYHDFHDEVKLYKQHWWRCNGPCQKRAPYFGTIRRATNRAPGPSDYWWKEHKQTCGGEFIKIKEPENYKNKRTENNQKSKPALKSTGKEKSIFDWLLKDVNPLEQHIPHASTPKAALIPKISLNTNNKISKPNLISKDSKNNNHSKSITNINKINNLNVQEGIKKLGNDKNNVHGWGVGGPNSSSISRITNNKVNSNIPKFSCVGQVGGSNTGKSKLLDKFYTKNSNQQQLNCTNVFTQKNDITTQTKVSQQEKVQYVNCPICNSSIHVNKINEHLDLCLVSGNNSSETNKSPNLSPIKLNNFTSTPKRKSVSHTLGFKQPRLDLESSFKSSDFKDCPVCQKSFTIIDIYDHIDVCLLNTSVPSNNSISSNSLHNSTSIVVSDSSLNSVSSNSICADSPSTSNSILCDGSETKKSKPHKCLICNIIIPVEISLCEHLEECIGTVFNDESTLSIESNLQESFTETSSRPTEKHPCPVCMELFSENNMNAHLDECLGKD